MMDVCDSIHCTPFISLKVIPEGIPPFEHSNYPLWNTTHEIRYAMEEMILMGGPDCA